MKQSLLILFLLISYCISSQVSQGGKPYYYGKNVNILKRSKILSSNKSISNFKLSELNNDSLNNVFSIKSTKREYVSVLRDLELDYKDVGEVIILPNNDRLWRVSIESTKAVKIGVIFKEFTLAAGCKVFIYSPDYKQILGAFTEKNNKSYNSLSISTILGDKLIIELFEPYEVIGESRLKVSKVIHNFKATKKMTGSCHNLVITEKALKWEKNIRSVVKLSVYSSSGDGWNCSGVILNNSKNDESPFVLTANHCLVENETSPAEAIYRAKNLTVYFNYQENADGTERLIQSVSGSEILAKSQELDFGLISLSSKIPNSYRPYFSGINLTVQDILQSKERVSIHHPRGSYKRISFSDEDVLTISYTGDMILEPNSHWEVFWTSGVTEGGSSGAPFFDANGNVLGVLSGGISVCNGAVVDKEKRNDLFSKIGLSWNKYREPNRQLQVWIDPNDTINDILEGYDSIETDLEVTSTNNLKNKIKLIEKRTKLAVIFNSTVSFRYNVNIYNSMGGLEISEKSQNKDSNDAINIQSLNLGVYFVQVLTSYRSFITKILIY